MDVVRNNFDKIADRIGDIVAQRSDHYSRANPHWTRTKAGIDYNGKTEYLEVILRNLEALIDQVDNYRNM